MSKPTGLEFFLWNSSPLGHSILQHNYLNIISNHLHYSIAMGFCLEILVIYDADPRCSALFSCWFIELVLFWFTHAVKFKFHFEFPMNYHLKLGLQISRIKDQNKKVILKIERHNYRVSHQLVPTFDFNSWIFWWSYHKNLICNFNPFGLT